MTIRMCKRTGIPLHASRSQARDREMSTGSLLRLIASLWILALASLERSCAYLHGTRRSRGDELLGEMQAKSASMCEVTFGIMIDICVKRNDSEHVLR